MRKSLMVVLFVLVAAIALAGSPALAAATPTAVSGVWTYVPGAFDPTKIVGPVESDQPNIFFTGDETGAWTGGFSGTSYDWFTGVGHPDGSLNAVLWVDFDGVVDGRSGTMTLKFNVYAAPDGSMGGTWVVKDAEGGLAGLHGTGTWEAVGDCVATYEGQVHW